MHMEVAGINFAVSCHYPLSVDRLQDTYHPFINNAVSPAADIHVNVRIETGDMPDTGQMTKVFDTGQSWSMFRQGTDYFLSLNFPSAGGRGIWLAAFDMYCDTITIYCSDLLINKGEGEGQTTCFTPLTYPLDQLLLMYILAAKGGALLHAAGADMNSRGYVFPGRSGAGKSTLSRLFLPIETAQVLSDDRIIIRKIDGIFMACGTPWAGDAGIAENKRVTLDRIFFIRHAGTNRVKELTPAEAVKRLMPVTSVPWYDRQAMQSILTFCEDLVLNIPAYELYFRPDAEMVTFLEDFITRGRI
ncbi:MAG: hypothetical protein HZB62_13870 [Nitrospirae bacterium]|nr:hypothetical protein [Nitrospirota bacterium]